MQQEILAPAAVLVVWTLVMLFWLATLRAPVFKAMGGASKIPRGGRGSDMEGRVPPRVAWASHNHTHLMEQPTLFYAVCVILAILGASEAQVLAAWIYTVSRIVHSLWQALVNIVLWRALLFLVGTVALGYLAVSAVLQALA